MARSHVSNQGGRSYQGNGVHTCRACPSYAVNGGSLDADARAVNRQAPSRYGYSGDEMSSDLVPQTPSYPANAVSASLEVGLLGQSKRTRQGKAEPLPPYYTGRDHSLCLPGFHRGCGYQGSPVRIGVIRLRPQPKRRIGPLSANALSLAGEVQPV
jgi:hypothetical protein